jgi:hypothetical protein
VRLRANGSFSAKAPNYTDALNSELARDARHELRERKGFFARCHHTDYYGVGPEVICNHCVPLHFSKYPPAEPGALSRPRVLVATEVAGQRQRLIFSNRLSSCPWFRM